MATGVSIFPSDLVAKQWSDSTILEMEKYSTVRNLIGEGPNNVIQRRSDLNAKKGNELEFHLLKKLTGAPTINEDELLGNEKKLDFVSDSVKIAEMAYGVRKYGRFEDIKSKLDLLKLAKGELALLLRETYDSYIIRLLSGDTTLDLGDSAWTGTAPTANRKLYGGDWDGATAVDPGDDWIRVRDISRFKTHARVTCGMRPVIVDGVETYVFLVHPYVWAKIRAADPDYENAVLYASERGRENPVWTGISGWWDGVAIFENDHIITDPSYATAYRNLFLGAQAGILAWGEGPYPGEQTLDVGRKTVVSLSMLWGFKKSILGPDDYANPSTYTDDYGVISCEGYGSAQAGLASDTEY